MSKIGIKIKIDATKLDKKRFFKGRKGTYIDLVSFVDPDSPGEYGDHGFVIQEPTKKEKDAGDRMPIVGNITVFWQRDDGEQSSEPRKAQTAEPVYDDQDIPF